MLSCPCLRNHTGLAHLLHQQALAWGVSKKIRLVQMADNTMPFKWMGVGP